MTESWQDRIIYMRPAEDLLSRAVDGPALWLHRVRDMILSCQDSVGPSFRQRGELRDMPVQIEPLNNPQSRVMQRALQMIPHRASAPRLMGNRTYRLRVRRLAAATFFISLFTNSRS